MMSCLPGLELVSDPISKITVFYGPSAWFRGELKEDKFPKSLIEIVTERDAQKNQLTVRQEGQQPVPEPEYVRPPYVFAETADYSMLTEGAINGFATLIQSIDPIELLLQNPPVALVKQLHQIYGAVEEIRYERTRPTLDALKAFNTTLRKDLVGQHAMKSELVASLYPLTRERQKKPIVLLFFGPSGVGKTETATKINLFCGGTLFRRQFSMFHSQKFASYLFGGEHNEASLARDLLERDNGVILFDEFDKANSTFHSAFYQLFDDGKFVDKNYRAEVGPAVIICTTNYQSREEAAKQLGDALASRFDCMIEFQYLSDAEVALIVGKAVDQQVSKLDSDEVGLIDAEEIKSKIKARVGRGQNIRELNSLVNNTINLILTREFLG